LRQRYGCGWMLEEAKVGEHVMGKSWNRGAGRWVGGLRFISGGHNANLRFARVRLTS
jgi:hypothetical protein